MERREKKMKKKIYFSISSILQVLGNIYVLANIKHIVQEQIDSTKELYASFSPEFQERVIGMLEKGGESFFVFLAIVGIILNLIILKEALTNNVLRKKGMLIGFSVANFFLGTTIISTIFSIINFIVLLCLKRKNPEDYPINEKKEIPHLEYEKSTKKEKIFGIILTIAYFSQYIWVGFIPKDAPHNIKIGIIIAFYVIMFILAMFVFKDRLKRDIKLFKENGNAYIRYILPRLGIMYVIYIGISFVCSIITKQATSVNQQAVESLPKWFMIPAAIIWAPVVEELLFRGVIRRFIKDDKIFIVISALAFGLIHSISEASVLSLAVMTIPYAVIGGFLAYIYSKTHNICTNILSHAIYNSIAMIMLNLLIG